MNSSSNNSNTNKFKDSILIKDLYQLKLIQPNLSSLKSRICGFSQPLHWLELNNIDCILIIFNDEWSPTHLNNHLNSSYFGGHRLICRLINSDWIFTTLSEGTWTSSESFKDTDFLDTNTSWDPQMDCIERQLLNMTLN